MAERRAEAGHPQGAANAARPPVPSPRTDRERIVLLECRLEQLRSQLEGARADADEARTRLAEAAARAADHALRHSLLHEELAHARAELAAVHTRLDRSEDLRAGLEGHLFEAGARSDAEQLVRLRQEILAERQRAVVNERALARLRERVEELLSSREMLFTRLAEWQRLVTDDGPEAADLSKYLSELRREILDLEHHSSAGEGREAALRERLVRAGLDPGAEPLPRPAEPAPAARPAAPPEAKEPATRAAPAPGRDGTAPEPVAAAAEPVVPVPEPAAPAAAPVATPAEPAPARDGTEGLVAALASADLPAVRSELLQRIGRTGRGELLDAVRPATESPEPAVRAAAYEALSRLLERDPSALEPHLRAGLADADPRVRRRVVLAAATARGLALRSLLGPLRDDPDPQVHRVVREVLRHAPPATADADPRLSPA